MDENNDKISNGICGLRKLVILYSYHRKNRINLVYYIGKYKDRTAFRLHDTYWDMISTPERFKGRKFKDFGIQYETESQNYTIVAKLGNTSISLIIEPTKYGYPELADVWVEYPGEQFGVILLGFGRSRKKKVWPKEDDDSQFIKG